MEEDVLSPTLAGGTSKNSRKQHEYSNRVKQMEGDTSKVQYQQYRKSYDNLLHPQKDDSRPIRGQGIRDLLQGSLGPVANGKYQDFNSFR